MEQDITIEEAQAMIEAPGFDAYGATRIYGIHSGEPYEGQIGAIKSMHHLRTHTYSRIYTVTRTSVPIRRA